MDADHRLLERLCDEHLAAADLSLTSQARIAHLEQAMRYAQQAVRAHPRPEPVEDRRMELAG